MFLMQCMLFTTIYLHIVTLAILIVFYNNLNIKKYIVMNVSYLQKNKTMIAAAVGVLGAAAIGVTLYYRSKPSEETKDSTLDKTHVTPASQQVTEDVSELVVQVRELEYNNSRAHESAVSDAQKAVAKQYVNSHFVDVCKGVERHVVSDVNTDAMQIVHPMHMVRSSIAKFAIQVSHNEPQLLATLEETLDNITKHINQRNSCHATLNAHMAKKPVFTITAKLYHDEMINSIAHIQYAAADDDEETIVETDDEKSVYVKQYKLVAVDSDDDGVKDQVTITRHDEAFCLGTQIYHMKDKADDIEGAYNGVGLLKAVVESAEGGAICDILVPENYQDKYPAAANSAITKRATEVNVQDMLKGDRDIVLAFMGPNYKTEKTHQPMAEFFYNTNVANKLFQHKATGGVYVFPSSQHFTHTVITSTLRNCSSDDSDYSVLYTVSHGALITKQVCDILEAYVFSLLTKYVPYYSLNNLLLDVDEKGARRPKVQPKIQDLCILIEKQQAKSTKQPLDMFVKDTVMLAANVAVNKLSQILSNMHIGDFTMPNDIATAALSLNMQQGKQAMNAIRSAVKQMRIKVVSATDKMVAVAYGSQNEKEYEQQLAQHRRTLADEKEKLAKYVKQFDDLYQFGLGTSTLAQKVYEDIDDLDAVSITFDKEKKDINDALRPRVLEHTVKNIYDAFKTSITAQPLARLVKQNKGAHDYSAESNLKFPTITTAELSTEDFRLRLAMYETNPTINTYVYRQNIGTLIADMQKATTQDVYCHLAEVVSSTDKGILESEKLQAEHDYMATVSQAIVDQQAYLHSRNITREENTQLLKTIKDTLSTQVEKEVKALQA